jgi:hypothetical protein
VKTIYVAAIVSSWCSLAGYLYYVHYRNEFAFRAGLITSIFNLILCSIAFIVAITS